MNFAKLIPVIISLLLLGAHFYRGKLLPLAILVLIFLFFLFIKERWVARLSQVILVIGALEWVRTLLKLVEIRQNMGMPWTRLALILGGVALFTGLSALVFQSRSLKERYAPRVSELEM
jgi:prepilin signal peptidase PulO-like enzyme (type II secretory pathway)